MGALVSFIQMVALPKDTWLRLLIWMFVGFIIYAIYGERHAHKRPAEDKEALLIQ